MKLNLNFRIANQHFRFDLRYFEKFQNEATVKNTWNSFGCHLFKSNGKCVIYLFLANLLKIIKFLGNPRVYMVHINSTLMLR